MAYSSSSSMQDLFYMDSHAPVASTSTASPLIPTRFMVDYAPKSPIHTWLAAHRPYLHHDEPSPTCSTPRSAFSDDEDEEVQQQEDDDESESEDSEEEDEREMIFLRPRRHGSASPLARSSSNIHHSSFPQQRLRQNVSAPQLPATTTTKKTTKTTTRRHSPRMIAALSSHRPRPVQPIVQRVDASGTSSFDAAPPATSHWSDSESDCSSSLSEQVEVSHRGRHPYRRSTLRPTDDEALWTVAPHELELEEEEDEEMPGLCQEGSSSTRSMPIPISPSPLRHPYFDPSRDDVSIVLDTSSNVHSVDTKHARHLFQKGQSFYHGWLREYTAAHH